jgi:hypothetical protein
VRGSPIGEESRNLDEGFSDQDGNRIEVARVGDEAKTLCLQSYRSPTAKWVEHSRWGATHGAPNLLSSLLQDFFIGAALPKDQALD